MSGMRFCPNCGAANADDQAICFACKQALPADANEPDSSGPAQTTLLRGRYRLLMRLGEGGYGAVYRAQDVHANGRFVAIKQINLSGLSTEEKIEATDSFNREVQLLASLRHPQVPRIQDQFSDRDHWYVVMDYIEGETLEEYLTRRLAHGKLPLDEVLDIGLQLCDVLTYLHTRQPPVIYRDLKPGNIMRTRSGRLYLIDFGIARHFRPGQARDTQPLGSPGYAAPEQYGRAQTTPRADIYSLGALLHTLLTGHDPGEQPLALAPLQLPGAQGGEELTRLVQKMLSLRPEERPASAEQVAATLKRIREGRTPLWQPASTISTSSATPLYTPPAQRQQQLQSHASPRRNAGVPRRYVLRGIMGALVLGGGLYLCGRRIVSNATTNSLTSDDLTATAINSTSTALNTYTRATWSPSLKYVALAQGGQGTLEVRATQSHELLNTLFTSNVNSIVCLWSPDEMNILFAPDDGELDTWNVITGQPQTSYRESILTQTKTAAWSPSGAYLASGGSNNLYIWEIGGKSLAEKHFSDTSMDLQALCWSPDNRHLAFIDANQYKTDGGTWSVIIWDRLTNEQTGSIVGQTDADETSPAPVMSWSPSGEFIALALGSSVWLLKPGVYGEAGLLRQIRPAPATWLLAWSPDGTRLALSDGKLLEAWRVVDHTRLLNVQKSDDPFIVTTATAGPSHESETGIQALAWTSASDSVLAAYSQNVPADDQGWTIGRWNIL